MRRRLVGGCAGPVDSGGRILDGRHQGGGERDRAEVTLHLVQFPLMALQGRQLTGEPIEFFAVAQALDRGTHRLDAAVAGLDRHACRGRDLFGLLLHLRRGVQIVGGGV